MEEQNANSRSLPELMTRKEVSNYLNISLVTLNNWSKKGIIKPHKINTRVRYLKKDILDFISNKESQN